jgi:hypothetical protein
MKRPVVLFIIAAIAVTTVAYAGRDRPDFSAGVWADGREWETRGTTSLSAPNIRSMESFDKLYIITNSNNPQGQPPVGEAGPGNPRYNGGRWYTHTVSWTKAGFTAYGTVPVLRSVDDITTHYILGHLTIEPGSPAGGPPEFFGCQLLAPQIGESEGRER